MASAQGAQSDSQLESDRIRKHWLQNSSEQHIRVRFLRFKAREEVLGAAREKGWVERHGKWLSFLQDLSRDII